MVSFQESLMETDTRGIRSFFVDGDDDGDQRKKERNERNIVVYSSCNYNRPV